MRHSGWIFGRAMRERKRTKPVRWRETMSFPTTRIIQIRHRVPYINRQCVTPAYEPESPSSSEGVKTILTLCNLSNYATLNRVQSDRKEYLFVLFNMIDLAWYKSQWLALDNKFWLDKIEICSRQLLGGVPERLIGAVLKTVVRASVPWVRIPPPPPFKSPNHKGLGLFILYTMCIIMVWQTFVLNQTFQSCTVKMILPLKAALCLGFNSSGSVRKKEKL